MNKLALTSFSSCRKGISSLLGTFQDKIDASNKGIREYLIHSVNHIDDVLPEYDYQCILSKISAYLIVMNLLMNREQDEEEQEFVDNLQIKLLGTIDEYNCNPDKLKDDLKGRSKDPNGITLTEPQEVFNKITNFYHFDHFIKASSIAQEILPQEHQLNEALKCFTPLISNSIKDIESDSDNFFNQKDLPELYQDKTISEMKQDPIVQTFNKWFKNIYNLQQNHPLLFQKVGNFRNFLDGWEFDSIGHYLKAKDREFKKLQKGSIAFQEEVEKEELAGAVESTLYLSDLKRELFQDLYEYIGEECFSHVKLLNPAILKILYHPSSESPTQVSDSMIGTEESKTQEIHTLGKDIVPDSDAV